MTGVWKDGGRPFAPLEERPLAEWIRDNAYRVVGLEVTARPREIQKAVRRLEILMTAGQDATLAIPALGEGSVSAENLRAVATRLQDPRQRLLEQFLWFWSSPDSPVRAALAEGDLAAAFARAEEKAGEGEAAGTHDRALLLFISVSSASRSDGWFRLGEVWQAVFDHQGIWDRVSGWIAEANAAELDPSTTEHLRGGLPPLLLRELVTRVLEAAAARRFVDTRRFLGAAHELGIGTDAVAAGLRRATDGAQARIESLCGTAAAEARADAENGAERCGQIASKLLDDCEPHLRLLDDALVDGDPARQTNHDRIANVALTAAIAHGNAKEDWETAVRLCTRILDIAVGKDARDRVEKNLEAAKGNHMGRLFAGLGGAGEHEAPEPVAPDAPPAALPDHCRWAEAAAKKDPRKGATLARSLLEACRRTPEANVDQVAQASLVCLSAHYDKTPGWKDAAELLGRIMALRPSAPVRASIIDKARNVVHFSTRQSVEAAGENPSDGAKAAKDLLDVWVDGPEAFAAASDADEICRNILAAALAQSAMNLAGMSGDLAQAKSIAERALRLATDSDLKPKIEALLRNLDPQSVPVPEDPRLAQLLLASQECRRPGKSPEEAAAGAEALLGQIALLQSDGSVDADSLAAMAEAITDTCIDCGVTVFNKCRDVFPLLRILMLGMRYARGEELPNKIRAILEQAALKGSLAVAQKAGQSSDQAGTLGRQLLEAWSAPPSPHVFPSGYPAPWRDAGAKAVLECARQLAGSADASEGAKLLRGALSLAQNSGLRVAITQELRSRELETKLSTGDAPEVGALIALCSSAPAAADKDGARGAELAKQLLDGLTTLITLVVPKTTEAVLSCLIDYYNKTKDWREFAGVLNRTLAIPPEADFLAKVRGILKPPVREACERTVERARKDNAFGLEGARLLATTWLDADFARVLPGGLPDDVANPLASAIAECLRCYAEVPNSEPVVVELLQRAAALATDKNLKGPLQEAVRQARIRSQLLTPGAKRILELSQLTRRQAIKDPARALELACELLDELEAPGLASVATGISPVDFNDVMLDVVLDCLVRHAGQKPNWDDVIAALERTGKFEMSAALRERLEKNLEIAKRHKMGKDDGAGDSDGDATEMMRRLAELLSQHSE